MAQYRVPLQLSYNREAADSAGPQPPDALGCSVVLATPAGDGNPFVIAFPIPRDSTIVRAELYFEGAGFSGRLTSTTGRSTWWVEEDGVLMAITANGAVTMSDDSRNVVTIAGLAAGVVVGVTAMQAFAYYKRGPNGGVGIAGVPTQGAAQPQWSSALVGAFADDALGDTPSLGNLQAMFAREELRLAGSGGGSTSVTLPTGALQVRQCDAAYTDPWGRVLLTASDIGNGQGQIPTTRGTWLASHFDAHPQTFVRLTNKVRGIAAAGRFGFTDVTPITGTPAVMRLYTVVRAPTHSTWLVVVDGQPEVVTFAHPAGSDLRRPVDIWNNVLVPAFQVSASVGGPGTPLGTAAAVTDAMQWEVDPGEGIYPQAGPFPAVNFRARGGLPRRLGYCSYARCLDVWDGLSPYDDPIYTEVVTTGP